MHIIHNFNNGQYAKLFFHSLGVDPTEMFLKYTTNFASCQVLKRKGNSKVTQTVHNFLQRKYYDSNITTLGQTINNLNPLNSQFTHYYILGNKNVRDYHTRW